MIVLEWITRCEHTVLFCRTRKLRALPAHLHSRSRGCAARILLEGESELPFGRHYRAQLFEQAHDFVGLHADDVLSAGTSLSATITADTYDAATGQLTLHGTEQSTSDDWQQAQYAMY